MHDEQPTGGAPPVVAVVVTHDSGPWLEDCLASLAAQDYPALSILVIDAGSAEDPTARVAAVAPGAFVRRLPTDAGYGATANDVLTVVEGASHFLFCHDDVAPDRDAVRELVEEAFRSNAGVIGPKIVEWNDESRLLAVGLSVDKLATRASVVERGELDQEQHDAVRDVFAVSGACMLVRADLFKSLGGFSAVLGSEGEDVDLCWRAQIAGARVVVNPEARVRHLEAGHAGMRPVAPDRTVGARNRLRTVLTCYGVWHLIRVLPQAAVLGIGELLFSLVTGDMARVREVSRAWTWNLRAGKEIRAARRTVHASRTISDGEVRRLQMRGSARLRRFVQQQLSGEGAGHSVATVGRDLGESFRRGSLRLPLLVWTVIAIVLLVGSRQLLSDGVPAIGTFTPFPSAGRFLQLFLSGWRTTGLGKAVAAPASFGILGLGGTVLLGGTGLLRQVLILGALPVAAMGAYRLARPFGGREARLAATVVYLAIPVPYNALAGGSWPGLWMFALAPFVLRRLAAATGIAPFAEGRPLLDHVLPLALLVAVLAAFVPGAFLVVPLLAVALVLGSVLAGAAGRALRALGVAVAATVGAVVLLAPWALDVVLPGGEWASVTGVAGPVARAASFGDLLRFDTGPIGGGAVGWAFVVAALLPLLIGRDWRLAWSIRMWMVATVCWLTAWAAGRGWLGVPVPQPEVLLALAAAAVALAVALGVVAFFIDLPGYAFGLRQVVAVLAAIAVAVGAVPVVVAAGGGRWRMPQSDQAQLLGWMPAEQESGSFRVLWVGNPDVLPLQGWRLSDGVAYGTSRNGVPDATDLWPQSSQGATSLLARDVNIARAGRTTRLGHLLAPMAVRYLALPTRLAPGAAGPRSPLPTDLVAALQSQLDLKQLPSDPSLLLYENVAWTPQRSVLSAEAADASRLRRPDAAGAVDMAGSDQVLPHVRGPLSFSGSVVSGQELLFGEAASSRWKLTVDGETQAHHTAFGFANGYTVGSDGSAQLRYRTPVTRYLVVAIELALWVLAIAAVVVFRRRRPPTLDIAPGVTDLPLGGVRQPVFRHRQHERDDGPLEEGW
jgi:GT2 family glycosyltransferase